MIATRLIVVMLPVKAFGCTTAGMISGLIKCKNEQLASVMTYRI